MRQSEDIVLSGSSCSTDMLLLTLRLWEVWVSLKQDKFDCSILVVDAGCEPVEEDHQEKV